MKLLPCPFCGGPARVTDCDRASFLAGCPPCDVWMPVKFAHTEEEAATSWNRRATSLQSLSPATLAAYAHVDSVMIKVSTTGHGWVVREAFEAGVEWQKRQPTSPHSSDSHPATPDEKS